MSAYPEIDAVLAGDAPAFDAESVRVFPRRTKATPTDPYAFVGDPPLLQPQAKQVSISCTFTWDMPEAERLVLAWRKQGYAVQLGGPAYGTPASEFTPGQFVREGMTITSRGCIRRCPFCLVPSREGSLRTLEIKAGWDVLDNNLLACPRPHIEAVLSMLDAQPKAARFTGGLDARLLKPWFAKRLAQMRLDILYTAYDSPYLRETVESAVKMLRDAGLRQRQVGCYVLIGFEGDLPTLAEERLEWVFEIGAVPYPMYFRRDDTRTSGIDWPWTTLVRNWSRPAIIFASHYGGSIHYSTTRRKKFATPKPLFTPEQAEPQQQQMFAAIRDRGAQAMTPEELATMEIEAAAWKSKDGRRAMKMLDLTLQPRVSLSMSGQVFSYVIRWGNQRCREGVPAGLAVAFLKQQAWRKFPHGLPMDYDHPGRTDTDRLIAAILASKKGTKP